MTFFVNVNVRYLQYWNHFQKDVNKCEFDIRFCSHKYKQLDYHSLNHELSTE